MHLFHQQSFQKTTSPIEKESIFWKFSFFNTPKSVSQWFKIIAVKEQYNFAENVNLNISCSRMININIQNIACTRKLQWFSNHWLQSFILQWLLIQWKYFPVDKLTFCLFIAALMLNDFFNGSKSRYNCLLHIWLRC